MENEQNEEQQSHYKIAHNEQESHYKIAHSVEDSQPNQQNTNNYKNASEFNNNTTNETPYKRLDTSSEPSAYKNVNSDSNSTIVWNFTNHIPTMKKTPNIRICDITSW